LHQENNTMPKQLFQRPPKMGQTAWSNKSDKGTKGPPSDQSGQRKGFRPKKAPAKPVKSD